MPFGVVIGKSFTSKEFNPAKSHGTNGIAGALSGNFNPGGLRRPLRCQSVLLTQLDCYVSKVQETYLSRLNSVETLRFRTSPNLEVLD